MSKVKVEEQISCKLYVGNIATTVTEDHLIEIFGCSEVVWFRNSPYPGYAILTFEDVAEAADALIRMHGKPLHNNRLHIELAIKHLPLRGDQLTMATLAQGGRRESIFASKEVRQLSHQNPQKAVSLDELPPDILPFIFDNLPMIQVIQLRALSKRWKTAIEEYFYKQTKLSLVEVTVKNTHELLLPISIDSLTNFLASIHQLCPRIFELSLELLCIDLEAIRSLAVLLTKYSATLEKLSLTVISSFTTEMGAASSIKTLANTINSLPNLNNLILVDSGQNQLKSFAQYLLPGIVPTLYRLDCFSLPSEHTTLTNIILAFLWTKATSLELHFATLSNLFFTGKYIGSMKNFPHVVRLIIQEARPSTLNHLAVLSPLKFPSLLSLEIHFTIPTELSSSLLCDLIDFKDLVVLRLEECIYSKQSLCKPRDRGRLLPYELASVQILYLRFTDDNCNEVDAEHFYSIIAAWFPRLVQLIIAGGGGRWNDTIEVGRARLRRVNIRFKA